VKYIARRIALLLGHLLPRLRRVLVREIRLARWRLAQGRRKTLTVTTEQGTFVVSTGDRALGRDLYYRREHELALIRATTAMLRARDLLPPRGRGTIIDVGANIGVISIGLLTLGEMERAVAVEPEPENFSLLRRNVALNGMNDRFHCLRLAVSDRRGSLGLELSDVNSGDHRVRSVAIHGEAFPDDAGRPRDVIAVDADRLDEMLDALPAEFARDVALIWLDVQGHEASVLRGGARTFSHGLPTVTEIWPWGLRCAGVEPPEFCALAAEYWSRYWVLRGERLVSYPTAVLDSYFEELGDGQRFGNVVFTR
jgi:FkbM family methyltransferase